MGLERENVGDPSRGFRKGALLPSLRVFLFPLWRFAEFEQSPTQSMTSILTDCDVWHSILAQHKSDVSQGIVALVRIDFLYFLLFQEWDRIWNIPDIVPALSA